MTYRQAERSYSPESVGDLDKRERDLLRAITENGGKCGLVRIAQRLARFETTEEPQPAHIRQLYTSLYHNEIQTLVDAGIVTYSDEQGEVQLTPRGRSLWPDSG